MITPMEPQKVHRTYFAHLRQGKGKQTGLRPYFICILIFGIAMLFFTYFTAFVAQFEHHVVFMSYENIFRLTLGINIVFFALFSAIMSYRLITGDTGKYKLTFRSSVPLSYGNIFLRKVFMVFIFVLLSMLACTLLPSIVFIATESFLPIVPDRITGDMLVMVFKTVLLSVSAVSITGLIAMETGYICRSLPAALISAVLLSSIYGNILVNPAGNHSLPPMPTCLLLAAALIVLIRLTIKLNKKEIENDKQQNR